MFQYAFLKQIEKDYGKENVLAVDYGFKDYDLRNFELNSIFGIQLDYAKHEDVSTFKNNSLLNKIIRRIRGNVYVSEYKIDSIEQLTQKIKKHKNVYLFGYWQSEKYFKDVIPDLKNTFSFPIQKLSNQNKELLAKIKETNSVSLHMRRGDYLNKDVDRIKGGICTTAYYQQAIREMRGLNEMPTFFVFSDDIEYAKSELDFKNCETHFVSWNTSEDSFWDLYLMSQCKHNVIANSSFSWWGAWLNDNVDKRVIAPKIWRFDEYNSDRLPAIWSKF